MRERLEHSLPPHFSAREHALPLRSSLHSGEHLGRQSPDLHSALELHNLLHALELRQSLTAGSGQVVEREEGEVGGGAEETHEVERGRAWKAGFEVADDGLRTRVDYVVERIGRAPSFYVGAEACISTKEGESVRE